MTTGPGPAGQSTQEAFDLGAFVAATLGEPTGLVADPKLTKRQHEEAHQILATCTPRTPQPVLAWAAGVITAGHALHFMLPVTEDTFKANGQGGSVLGSGRFYMADRSGLEVSGGVDEPRIRLRGWGATAALFGPDTIPPDLYAQMTDAMLRLRDLTEPAGWAHWDDPINDEWRDVNYLCGDLAALVWDRARPVELAGALR